MNLNVLTVKQLNTYVRSVLEGDINLISVCVTGEISNLRSYASGHLYFTLSDSGSAIRTVMFSGNAARMQFVPSDGMRVMCRGRVTIYEKDGTYQLMCESMAPEGVGDVALRYQMLRERLEREGYFDLEHKKKIPQFPSAIAVVTSPDGAVLHDIISVLGRRYPVCEIRFFPALVQGEGAANSLIKAVCSADESGADCIIIGRGGGSKEDLSAFNDEQLAKTVYGLKTPVISAVGHETDYTICDYVADLRAPTPSAAAELAAPDISELKAILKSGKEALKNAYLTNISQKYMQLSILEKNRVYKMPKMLYEAYETRLKSLHERFCFGYARNLEAAEKSIAVFAGRLSALSPLNILSRGYSLVYSNGKIVKSPENVNNNDRMLIKTSGGSLELTASEVKRMYEHEDL